MGDTALPRAAALRPAVPADVGSIQGVGLRTWPQTYLAVTTPEFVLDGLARWWSADAVRSCVVDDATVVAEVDDEVVGMVTLGVLGDARVLWRLYVVPEHQGRGLGGALLRAVLAGAGDDAVLVELVEGNERARRCYERHGFVPHRIDRDAEGPAIVWLRRPAVARPRAGAAGRPFPS